MLRWLAPTLVYVVGVGALGITGKLALRTLAWPQLVLWTAVAYATVAAVLLLTGHAAVRFTHGTLWALASGGLAVGSLVVLYLALGPGEAGKVIAISAAYPAITLLLAAAFLSEALTVGRVVGAGLVVAGVVTLTLAR
jgi:bacterial/archaeal transporter family protein